jgi:beta-glucosidase
LTPEGFPRSVTTLTKSERPTLQLTSTFTPDTDGDWEFALGSMGSANLFIDGQLVVNNSSNWTAGELWFNMGSTERRGVLRGLKKDKQYPLEVRCSQRVDLRGSPFKSAGAIRVGALPLIDADKAIAEAVEVAKASDVAVVVVGLNGDFESEGYDRKHMDLPGTSNKLVSEIIKANPKTIIVNQTGTPVSMPWINEAQTLVQVSGKRCSKAGLDGLPST